MQHLKGQKRNGNTNLAFRFGVWGPALAWAAGLLLAGSDGPWMPYANIGGFLIFLAATIRLGQVLPGLDRNRQRGNPAPGPATRPAPRSALTPPRDKTGARPLQQGHTGRLGLI